MPNHSPRLSPALILTIAALIAAGGATAIAAGELITRGDQIAAGVIDGNGCTGSWRGSSRSSRAVNSLWCWQPG